MITYHIETEGLHVTVSHVVHVRYRSGNILETVQGVDVLLIYYTDH